MLLAVFIACVFHLANGLEVKCPIGCTNKSQSHFVKDFCDKLNGTMNERCCVKNETEHFIIGIDLSFCGLSEFHIKNVWPDGVEIIDLTNNELKSMSKDDFTGYVGLNYLYLPDYAECPGGEDAWGSIKNHSDSYKECEFQLNPCKYLNVSCTINGECLHQGPGKAKCVCLPDHYGYKCLQQGVFPIATMVLGLVLPTTLLSAISWFYFRRNITPLKID